MAISLLILRHRFDDAIEEFPFAVRKRFVERPL
jgi:hypothetical protein